MFIFCSTILELLENFESLKNLKYEYNLISLNSNGLFEFELFV